MASRTYNGCEGPYCEVPRCDGGTGLGKSKNGRVGGMTADWLDVEMAVRAIDGIHLGRTIVAILPVGTGTSGGLNIAIITTWETLPGGSAIPDVITERATRELGSDALPAFVLGGLYAHDFAVGSVYQQTKIPL